MRHLKKRYEALGLSMFIDMDDLRSGATWKDALIRMIDRSDLFQLFWSLHAAESEYVAAEWRHALDISSAKGARFIRPIYWHDPMPQAPEELKEINFRKIEFIQKQPTAPPQP